MIAGSCQLAVIRIVFLNNAVSRLNEASGLLVVDYLL